MADDGSNTYDGTRSTAFRTVTFLILILGGQVLLLPVTLTFIFAKSIVRQPSLIHFCVAWSAFSIFACLLLYSGNIDTANPPAALCHVQVSGMLGCYVLAGVAALCLSLQVYLATPNGDRPRPARRFEPVLAYLPPLAWTAHQLAYLITHYTREGGIVVARRDQICVVEEPHSMTRNTQYVAAAGAGMSILCTIVMLVKAFQYLRGQSLSFRKLITSRRRSGNTGIWLRILVRLCTFEVYCLIMVLIVIIMSLKRHSSPIRQTIDFLVDTVPLVSFLVFGTSPDILVAWRLKKPRSDTSTGTSWTTSTTQRRATIPPPVPPKDYELGETDKDSYGLVSVGALSPSLTPGVSTANSPHGTFSPLISPPPSARSWQTVHLYAEQARRDPALQSATASVNTFESTEPLQQLREMRTDPHWGASRHRVGGSGSGSVDLRGGHSRVSFDNHPFRQAAYQHQHDNDSYHDLTRTTHTRNGVGH